MSDDIHEKSQLNDALAPLLARVEAALAEVADAFTGPTELADVMRYALLGGGKRIRPVLAVATCDALGGSPSDAYAAACAIEMVHAYSLVHDDLPALDDDVERRGRPTAHVQFGEALAVLAGDALLTEAFGLIASTPAAAGPEFQVRTLRSLAACAGTAGMVGGQVVDIEHLASGEDALFDMHSMKTGALFVCACVMGALAAGASDAVIDQVATYGRAFGAAFQLSDDMLDLDEVAASEHEALVNLAHIMGEARARAGVRACVDRGRGALAELESGRFELHETLLDWVAQRVEA